MTNGALNEEDVQGQMETRTRIFIRGMEEEALIDRAERTGLGTGGMSETVDIRLTRANACNHLIHTGSEAGAVCVGCHGILCSTCASDEFNMCCSKCGKVVCGSCQRRTWLRENDQILCPGCAWRVRFGGLVTAVVITAVVYFIVVIVFRFLGNGI